MDTGHPRWQAPVPLTDAVLKCRFCDWTVPLSYANATDKRQIPRDGHNRLAHHVDRQHYAERRALGGRSTSADVRGF